MILCKDNLNKINDWYNNTLKDGGILLIDKPKEWTSFDVVNKIKKVTQINKIGHTGTLDPFATGLLILLFNKYTKRQSEFTGLDKTYFAKIKLGATTKTFDPTSPEENLTTLDNLSNAEILSVIKSFEGIYMQVPPMFSAKKVKGERLYKLARQNKTVEIEPKAVQIYSINVNQIELPFVTFEVKCSKGTYIRSLANDIGEKLGVGAYLFELRRTQIGDFSVNNALNLEEFLGEFKKVIDGSI
jgi:tRNA pseudouridine55 synthase